MITAASSRRFFGATLGVIGTGIGIAPAQAQRSTPTQRLRELGISLPPLAPAIGTYVPAVKVGNLLFVSGHGPALLPDGTRTTGKVGRDVSLAEAQAAARRVGLSSLASIQSSIGSIDRVVRLVRVFGMVNVAPGFIQTPEVINGFSDLMVDIFGEANGKAARSAVGMAELPLNIPVEIESVFEIRS